jgi:hypothetical protein
MDIEIRRADLYSAVTEAVVDGLQKVQEVQAEVDPNVWTTKRRN